MRRVALSVALLGTLPITSGAAIAAVDRAVLEQLDTSAKQTRTLSAEFTQKNRMKLFRQLLSSRGRLYFQSPRQIRWEYTQPDPSVLILDGKQATMRSPGAEPQVFDLDKDPTLRAVFDQLLTFVGGGSLADAQAAYAIETQGPAAEPTLILTPKPGGPVAKAFSRIELGFDKQRLVRTIKLVEPNGDEKEIVFTRVEKNGKLPADAFR